ncbi:PI-PLC X domain-containing protein, partial [Trifolium pratense]
AGASFGSCKNISVPSTSPVSSTGGSGSFTGSVQFSKSASPIRYPNSVLVLFYIMLIAVSLKL